MIYVTDAFLQEVQDLTRDRPATRQELRDLGRRTGCDPADIEKLIALTTPSAEEIFVSLDAAKNFGDFHAALRAASPSAAEKFTASLLASVSNDGLGSLH